MAVLRTLWTLVVLLAFALGSSGLSVGKTEVESQSEDREEQLLHRRGKLQTVRVRARRDREQHEASASVDPDAPVSSVGQPTGAVALRLVPLHDHTPQRIEFAIRLSMRTRGPPIVSPS